jgi:hypothetical protein
VGKIDLTHPACTEKRTDLIVSKTCSGGERHGVDTVDDVD